MSLPAASRIQARRSFQLEPDAGWIALPWSVRSETDAADITILCYTIHSMYRLISFFLRIALSPHIHAFELTCAVIWVCQKAIRPLVRARTALHPAAPGSRRVSRYPSSLYVAFLPGLLEEQLDLDAADAHSRDLSARPCPRAAIDSYRQHGPLDRLQGVLGGRCETGDCGDDKEGVSVGRWDQGVVVSWPSARGCNGPDCARAKDRRLRCVVTWLRARLQVFNKAVDGTGQAASGIECRSGATQVGTWTGD